ELVRPAQGDEMTAVDLIGDDAQAFAGDAPLERRREEAIVAADEHARGDLGPGTERPWLFHRRHRLLRLAAPECLGDDLRRDVMKVKDRWIFGVFGRELDRREEFALRRPLSGVVPPL